jgi:hypothetical protein
MRTHDPPACSIVPQPSTLPHAPLLVVIVVSWEAHISYMLISHKHNWLSIYPVVSTELPYPCDLNIILLKGTVSNSGYISLYDYVTVNNEMERMWMEVVIAWFRITSWHLPEGTKESTKKISVRKKVPKKSQWGSLCPNHDLGWALPNTSQSHYSSANLFTMQFATFMNKYHITNSMSSSIQKYF